MGHNVTMLDTHTTLTLRFSQFFIVRVFRKLFGNSWDLGLVNIRARKIIDKNSFDLVWLEKSVVLKPKFFKYLKCRHPELKILGYTPDDCLNPANQSSRFLATLPFYDLFCTTKSYNREELLLLGCHRTFFVENAYHAALHRPLKMTDYEIDFLGGDVVFVGSWEAERAASILALAAAGVAVRVWGNGWEKMGAAPKNIRIEYRALYGEEYVKIINSSKINLNFLRKMNRDLQTTRSIEIPACSAFMLSERSDEHLNLFAEGNEAEFFESDEELVRKAKYYLAHDIERQAIARSGRNRCLTSGYSNEGRLGAILDQVRRLT